MSIDMISKKIKLFRRVKGLTQSELAKKSGVSQSQISTIENGDCDVKISTLVSLTDAMNISLTDLFSDYSNIDNNTFINENEYDDYEVTLNLYNNLNIQKTFYPPKYDDIKISTLMDFIVYLPLIDIEYLFMILSRTYGNFNLREEYICKQFDWLVNQIPDSPAKQYADYVYLIIQERKKLNNPELKAELKIDGGCVEYNEQINKKESLYRDLNHLMSLYNNINTTLNAQTHSKHNDNEE